MASQTFLPQQCFRQGDEFCAGIRLPDDAAIGLQAHNGSGHGTAQSADTVAGVEVGALAERVNDFHHRLVVKHAGNAVCDGGRDFAKAGMGQISEKGGGNLAANVGKGVAVEEEERRSPVAGEQEVYGFVEGEDGVALFFPLSCCRFLSFAINAVLRSASFARCSVEADDKLPTPVLEKSGSGL